MSTWQAPTSWQVLLCRAATCYVPCARPGRFGLEQRWMAITDFAAAIAAGLAHLDQGRPEMAAFLFGEVLEARPTLPDAINGMASAMMRLGVRAC